MGWKQPARASLDWSVSAVRGMNISVRPKPGKKAVTKVGPALQESPELDRAALEGDDPQRRPESPPTILPSLLGLEKSF